MRIAVDAMGGDFAPAVPVLGAVKAVREAGVNVVLVGNTPFLEKALMEQEAADLRIPIRHASEVVEMDEKPAVALRKKKDSSIRVAVEMVKNGEAHAMVSAGNTGAAVAAATLSLRTLKGIDRPAIAAILPTLKGTAIIIDVGANVDCPATQLYQFAVMGSVYAKYILNKSEPTVGLLSIGEEDTKGNDITREVLQMLKESSLNFIGNVEGRAIYQGEADVIVCDGFTGNVAIKISESVAEFFTQSVRRAFTHTAYGRLGGLLFRRQFGAIKASMDYTEYGGAPLLGVNGVCIIAHGSSAPKAIKNAILVAQKFVDNKINEQIMLDLGSTSEISAERNRKSPFWKNLKETLPFSSEKNRKG